MRAGQFRCVAWLLPDERGKAAADLLDAIIASGAVAPALWPFEIANALPMAERRHRLTPGEASKAGAILITLPVQIEPTAVRRTVTETTRLAMAHGLTAYDASYLEPAARRLAAGNAGSGAPARSGSMSGEVAASRRARTASVCSGRTP